MKFVPTVKLRYVVRSWLVSLINLAGGRAQSYPGFKRFALTLLRGQPGLQHKLRRIYLESQYEDQPQPENWSGLPTEVVMPLTPDVADDRKCVIALHPLGGINANQRSPLEAYFHSYRGRQ